MGLDSRASSPSSAPIASPTANTPPPTPVTDHDEQLSSVLLENGPYGTDEIASDGRLAPLGDRRTVFHDSKTEPAPLTVPAPPEPALFASPGGNATL